MQSIAGEDLITIAEGSEVLTRLNADQEADKRLMQEAEHYILRFDEELAAYQCAKDEFLRKAADANSGIRGGGPGRPTESRAIQSIRFDEGYPALRWLKAVEILRRGLGERKNIFIRVRVEAARQRGSSRQKGRPGWVGYVQRRYAEELERRFLVEEVHSDRAIRSCWRGILARAVAVYKKIP